MNLCLFDLDHTLLPLDSDHEFGEFLIRQGLADPVEYRRRNDVFYTQYCEGTLVLGDYIQFTTSIWRQLDHVGQQGLQQAFMEEVIRPAMQPQALDAASASRCPPAEHGIDPALVDERALKVVTRSRKRASRPTSSAAPCATCCWACGPRTSTSPPTPRPSRSRPVPPRLHHRPALPHRPRGVRPRPRARGDRGLDLPRLPRQRRGRAGEPATRRPARANWRHEARVDASGRVLRDNVWGPQEEDAARRDFTINAMYYDPERRRRGRLPRRHQGREEARAAHDRRPGRRATAKTRCASSAPCASRLKLGFKIEPKTRAPIKEMAGAARQRAAVAALFDEMLKLLQTGHSLATIEQLKKLGMAPRRLPAARRLVVERADDSREKFVRSRCRTPTAASAKGKPVAPSFLLACVLWHDVRDGWQPRQAAGSIRSRRCRSRSTTCSTRASATSPAAASWPPTCARSG
jgi:hypothetical protein